MLYVHDIQALSSSNTGIKLNIALHQSIVNLLTVISPAEGWANHSDYSDYSLSSLVSNVNVDLC